jgi:hypothetical protein
MNFQIKTVDEAIELFNEPILFNDNRCIGEKASITIEILTKEEEEFIRKNHNKILRENKISRWFWKPDDEGYIRYDLKDTTTGMIKLFRDNVEVYN